VFNRYEAAIFPQNSYSESQSFCASFGEFLKESWVCIKNACFYCYLLYAIGIYSGCFVELETRKEETNDEWEERELDVL
jgi:hypothetical protein